MNVKTLLVLPVCVSAVFILWISGSSGATISNLTKACLKCICHVATVCNTSRGCVDGYCGPYKISKIYWNEVDDVVLPGDEKTRVNAWRDCARNYGCAQRMVEKYMEKFGRDCNVDGVTNCLDFVMIHYNGGYGCKTPLNATENARSWLQRYEQCKI